MATYNKKSRIPKPLVSDSLKQTQSSSSVINPLAKAMLEKKPTSHSHTHTTTNNDPPETWIDEKKVSVSQKQHQQNKTEQEVRKDQLFAQLNQTEDELVTIKGLIEKREKLMQEAEEESKKENESKQGEGSGATEPKITKKSMRNMRERMELMRDKLHKMNNDTDHYLADIENTMQYLDTLETASNKLGPLSVETRRLFGNLDDEEIIAKIGAENNKQNTGNSTKKKTEETDDEEEEEGKRRTNATNVVKLKHKEEEEGVLHRNADSESDDDDLGEEELEKKAQNNHERMLKFFLTERTAVTGAVPTSEEQDGDLLSDNSNSDDDDDGK